MNCQNKTVCFALKLVGAAEKTPKIATAAFLLKWAACRLLPASPLVSAFTPGWQKHGYKAK
jgi:hypothetical protein